jgi:hypothetical protein
MNERERKLRAGAWEHYGPLLLYWEPHFEPDERGIMMPRQSFTIDGDGGKRYRYATLAEADEKLAELRQKYAIEIAMDALGLNRRRRLN